MNKPHKHKDLIIAWANGAEIQGKDKCTGNWVDCTSPTWLPTFEYRIKPEVIRYKRYLAKDSGMGYIVKAHHPEGTLSGVFIKWIDTEWQEVEV